MPSKKKALTLTIPEPCSENFNKMTPVKGGKFCGSCEKTIVDFRTMSDGQILNFYKKNNGKTCGVFNEGQLNRAMSFPMEAKPNRNWKAVAALAAGLMFGNGLIGQSMIPKTGELTVVEKRLVKENVADEKDNTTANRVIQGQVTDMSEEPLIGANILISGKSIGAITDLDGNFKLTIPEGMSTFKIEVSYTGYETQILLFDENNPIITSKIEIVLQEGILLVGAVVVDNAVQHLSGVTGGVTWITAESEDFPEPDVIVEENIPVSPEIKIFPNPFISNLNVTYAYETKGDYLFHVYDMNGRLLFAKTYNLLKGKQTIELEVAALNLVDGAYILQLSDKQDRILATKKVFKGKHR